MIKARNYSVSFGYFTKYVILPEWLFENYNDSELYEKCIEYVNNITCNTPHINEKFELYTKVTKR